MKQIYVENIPWGEVEFDPKFKDTLDSVLLEVLRKHPVVDSFVDSLDKILTALTAHQGGKKFLPSSEVCSKCKTSHEATEFLWALSIGLASTLLSEEFASKLKPVLEKHGIKADTPF